MTVGADGGLTLAGAARDADGTGATCRAEVGTDRNLATLVADPGVPGSGRLIGRLVGRGFRAAVDGLCEPGTLASVLLCELPVAALLSGYGSLYTGRFPSPMSDEFLAGLPVDICAGWAGSASMVVRIRDERSIPTPGGPVSPGDDDPVAGRPPPWGWWTTSGMSVGAVPTVARAVGTTCLRWPRTRCAASA
jgi:hypothetical protein